MSHQTSSFFSGLQPYLQLARFDRSIGSWLLWIPCVWGILLAPSVAGEGRLWLCFLLLVGSFVMRGAGCVVNDMWDRNIDKSVARTRQRPLASGRVKMWQAWLFLFCLLALGFGVFIQLNRLAWLCCFAVIPLVIIYPLSKRFIWCPQLILGMAFGSGSIIGYAAACGKLTEAAMWLYLGSILWILGFDTIYGFQDIADDKTIGVKSFSQVVAYHPRQAIGLIYCGSGLALAMSAYLNHVTWLFWPVWFYAFVLLLTQARDLRTSDPAFCRQQFLANKTIGFLFAIAFGLGLMPV